MHALIYEGVCVVYKYCLTAVVWNILQQSLVRDDDLSESVEGDVSTWLTSSCGEEWTSIFNYIDSCVDMIMNFIILANETIILQTLSFPYCTDGGNGIVTKCLQ